MQHNIILEPEPWGLPLTEKLLPEHLKDLGYTCRAVGKWHLGYFKKAYTPTLRGFDSFYGLWNGYQDYYTHMVQATFTSFEGFDMRRDLETDWSSMGKYSTRVFTDEAVNIIRDHNNTKNPLFLYLAHIAPHSGPYTNPLQAPPEEVQKLNYIKDENRRKFTAMVKVLDDSVGNVVDALKIKGMLDDTIIVFLSDNGAPTNGIHRNYGSNWPLKGEKGTPWEGGTRTPAFVWSRFLKNKRRVSNGLMHISDWMPTLYRAAGGDVANLNKIDGINMWDTWQNNINDESWPRNSLLYNIDDVSGYAAVRDSIYKYISGTTFLGFLDYWSERPCQIMGNNSFNYSDMVLSSIVGQIMSKTNLDRKSLSDDEILRLRQQSKVNCARYNKNSKPCQPRRRPCLFNVVKDPCEQVNLNYNPNSRMQALVKSKVEYFERLLDNYRGVLLVQPVNQRTSGRVADPKLYNNTWSSWEDQDQKTY
ncbi:arylsulfatase B-like isoform X2 [Daktulosphaira vitifoliae]|nr:arylsulfatase B-like isoform X2 [Daktulosphaira vitifoliae]